MAQIDPLLELVIREKASDLHLTTSYPPYIRKHGEMEAVTSHPVLTDEAVRELLLEVAPEFNRKELDERWDTDFAYDIPELARFRVNIFFDRNGIGGVLRQIPSQIPTAEQLKLPKAIRDFCMLSKGLVVVTGPTGSGKSTTLAAMVDLINRTRTDHIITVEDPIEFVHTPRKCLINQREVHRHTRSFANALRAALREDPDVLLVGEMRDLETMEIAIETAETGHLVFGTLHTNTAASTVERVIDKFPSDRQNQIRTMLADALKGVVAQTLCRCKTPGRVAAYEILVATAGVSALIRDNKTHQIPSIMQVSRGAGMQTMNDALLALVLDGSISPQEACFRSVDKDALTKKYCEAGIPFLPASLGAAESAAAEDAGGAARLAKLTAALQEAQAVLHREPDNLHALNNAAWIMSTSPEASLRNGKEAIRLAERALGLSGGKDPQILDTVATAYAEAGMFPRAIEMANRALQLARAAGNRELCDAIEGQLRLYEAGRPRRDH